MLLLYTPGLSTAIAHTNAFPMDPKQFRQGLKKVFQQLFINKGRYHPIVHLPRHGLTAECTDSGLSAEIYNNKNVDKYVSAGTNAKIDAAGLSKKEIEDKYLKECPHGYCFSNDLEDLGGIRDEDSHIAIVHIDGNAVGRHFQDAESLMDLQKLSVTVDGAMKNAFAALIKDITNKGHYSNIMQDLGWKRTAEVEGTNKNDVSGPLEYALTGTSLQNITGELVDSKFDMTPLNILRDSRFTTKKDFLAAVQQIVGQNISEDEVKCIVKHSTRKILPIRPIILGGDDLTFVCDGKLGLYFSQMIIQELEKTDISPGNKFTACAGIAVIKTKYPFYRGYILAEELCSNAKKAWRSEDCPNCSFIDFQISLGSISGSLQQIRHRGFRNHFFAGSDQGTLLHRPYIVQMKTGYAKKISFLEMLEHVHEFSNWPETKLNDLRETLYKSEEARSEFVKRLQYRKWSLPRIEGRGFEENLFENGETPYFDMLEIKQFYPKFALEKSRRTDGDL